MPSGLAGPPVTFVGLIDALFGPECELYVFGLVDIIIVTMALEEHLKWLEVVLNKLVDAGLKVNEYKCELCCVSLRESDVFGVRFRCRGFAARRE